MKRYPVYKALYKPMFTVGVPLPLLIIEVTLTAIFASMSLFLAIIPIVVVHIIAMSALKHDPFILSVLMDISALKGGKNEKR